jgi:hypothetical protein
VCLSAQCSRLLEFDDSSHKQATGLPVPHCQQMKDIWQLQQYHMSDGATIAAHQLRSDTRTGDSLVVLHANGCYFSALPFPHILQASCLNFITDVQI